MTPGPGQTGSSSQLESARQSHPVQVSENVRQSESLRHGAGGGSHASWMQTPPGGVQMPQLALQQTSPGAQTAGPQAPPPGTHFP
jgi:hypothetical protein